MPQTITTGIKTLVDRANAEIETLAAVDAVKLHGRDDVVLVDIRDPRELERDGVLSRTVFAEVPPRVEYRVTEHGATLKPVLEAMCQWGRSHWQQQPTA